MTNNQNQQRLSDVEDILAEIREQLEYTQETGDVYELRALQLLLQIVRLMHSQPDVYTLMTLILDSALSFIEADRAFLLLLNDNNELRFKMGRTYSGSYLNPEDFVVSTGVIQEALDGLKPVILVDAQTDSDFNKRQSIQDLKLRTVMAAPLQYHNSTLGLIYVDSKRPLVRFSKHHLNVLTSLADQAAVAITNAQKFETHTG